MNLIDIDRMLGRLPSWIRVIVEHLRATIDELTGRVEALESENAALKRQLYGRKSEKMPPMQREVDKAKRKDETPEQKAERRKKAQKKRRKNRDKKKALPVVEVQTTLPAEQRTCPKCGGDRFKRWSRGKVSYRVEFIDIRIVRERIERERWGCDCGECVLTAPPAPTVSEGVHYGPGFHAFVVVAKCADSLPLTRQVKQLKRAAVHASKSTLCDLFHRSAELLKPLYDRMLELIADEPHVHADETTLKIQQKGGCRTGWFWVFTAKGIVAYVFSSSRSGQTPVRVLGDSTGTLQVDAYSGYNQVSTPDRRTRAGCWSHVRRKFFEALGYAQDVAAPIMALILDLYLIEHVAKQRDMVGTEQHLELRQEHSRSVVDDIKNKVDQQLPLHPPSSPIGKALSYASNNWNSLVIFIEEPLVALDNNISERMLRVVALGRKNYMFANNNGAAQNIAMAQSLVTSCEVNNINPQHYLADVLIRIQDTPMSRIDELLPMNWKPPDGPSG